MAAVAVQGVPYVATLIVELGRTLACGADPKHIPGSHMHEHPVPPCQLVATYRKLSEVPLTASV